MDKEDFKVRLGEKIAYYRKRKGLTQQALGDEVGKERQDISNIEHGRMVISSYLVYKIAQALDVTPNELMGF